MGGLKRRGPKRAPKALYSTPKCKSSTGRPFDPRTQLPLGQVKAQFEPALDWRAAVLAHWAENFDELMIRQANNMLVGYPVWAMMVQADGDVASKVGDWTLATAPLTMALPAQAAAAAWLGAPSTVIVAMVRTKIRIDALTSFMENF